MRVPFYVDASNWTLSDDLPLCNLLTYFVSSLGSVLVQKEFAKPIQHEKCPKNEHLNSTHIIIKKARITHPCRVTGVGFTTLFKLMNSIVIP
jgi:hypothetical protein